MSQSNNQVSRQTTQVKLSQDLPNSRDSQIPSPENITIIETQWPNDEEMIMPTKNTIYLSQKIDEFIFKLGYSSVHTVGILLQLLIDGKIRITYKNHTERLELVDNQNIMSRRDALDMFEKYLANREEKETLSEAEEISDKALMTQKIIVQIPGEYQKQSNS